MYKIFIQTIAGLVLVLFTLDLGHEIVAVHEVPVVTIGSGITGPGILRISAPVDTDSTFCHGSPCSSLAQPGQSPTLKLSVQRGLIATPHCFLIRLASKPGLPIVEVCYCRVVKLGSSAGKAIFSPNRNLAIKRECHPFTGEVTALACQCIDSD